MEKILALVYGDKIKEGEWANYIKSTLDSLFKRTSDQECISLKEFEAYQGDIVLIYYWIHKILISLIQPLHPRLYSIEKHFSIAFEVENIMNQYKFSKQNTHQLRQLFYSKCAYYSNLYSNSITSSMNNESFLALSQPLKSSYSYLIHDITSYSSWHPHILSPSSTKNKKELSFNELLEWIKPITENIQLLRPLFYANIKSLRYIWRFGQFAEFCIIFGNSSMENRLIYLCQAFQYEYDNILPSDEDFLSKSHDFKANEWMKMLMAGKLYEYIHSESDMSNHNTSLPAQTAQTSLSKSSSFNGNFNIVIARDNSEYQKKYVHSSYALVSCDGMERMIYVLSQPLDYSRKDLSSVPTPQQSPTVKNGKKIPLNSKFDEPTSPLSYEFKTLSDYKQFSKLSDGLTNDLKAVLQQGQWNAFTSFDILSAVFGSLDLNVVMGYVASCDAILCHDAVYLVKLTLWEYGAMIALVTYYSKLSFATAIVTHEELCLRNHRLILSRNHKARTSMKNRPQKSSL
jgi:hypothetical protein